MPSDDGTLLRRGIRLEQFTLAWNVVGVGVLAATAIAARSIALAAFGFDSLVEIAASTVVMWELTSDDRQRTAQALRLIGFAFVVLVPYVIGVAVVSLVAGGHPRHSRYGMAWTAGTFAVMASLAIAKRTTGRALHNEVLITEGRVTAVDAYLAASVLVGLALNTFVGWWWADPLASLVIVFYAVREALHIFAAES
ncbi:MAG: cation efflux protein [Acidimicrobiales bacterium]|jgi:divalent metal cation (Fe/Co/Zn/Cd) transporter|nr:cation efflux protein [Acidimicrobiales bacterium]